MRGSVRAAKLISFTAARMPALMRNHPGSLGGMTSTLCLAAAPARHTVELEFVADQIKAEIVRHTPLQLLDLVVAELDDAAGFDIDKVIVVFPRRRLVAAAPGTKVV